MRRFLLGALAMGAVFVLSSFALTRNPSPVGGPAWTVSQYQLDRAFRLEIDSSQLPLTLPAPITSGIILTQLKLAGSSCASINVTVDGVPERFDFGTNLSSGMFLYDLNPPIIVRPGQTLGVTGIGPGGCGGTRLTFAGYTTLPGET